MPNPWQFIPGMEGFQDPNEFIVPQQQQPPGSAQAAAAADAASRAAGSANQRTQGTGYAPAPGTGNQRTQGVGYQPARPGVRAETSQAATTPGELARDADIYNPRNPQGALRAAMRAMGMNTMSINPVIRYMMNMAPGLASSFLINGANSGVTADAATAQGDVPGMFKNFLMTRLQNNGTGLVNALRNPLAGTQHQGEDGHSGAAGGLLSLERRLNEYRNAAGAPGSDATQGSLNPFSAYINNLFRDDPNAAPGFAASLYTPFLGPFGQAYTEGVGNLYEMGRNQVREPGTPTDDNPFSWLINPATRRW